MSMVILPLQSNWGGFILWGGDWILVDALSIKTLFSSSTDISSIKFSTSLHKSLAGDAQMCSKMFWFSTLGTNNLSPAFCQHNLILYSGRNRCRLVSAQRTSAGFSLRLEGSAILWYCLPFKQIFIHKLLLWFRHFINTIQSHLVR